MQQFDQINSLFHDPAGSVYNNLSWFRFRVDKVHLRSRRDGRDKKATHRGLDNIFRVYTAVHFHQQLFSGQADQATLAADG